MQCFITLASSLDAASHRNELDRCCEVNPPWQNETFPSQNAEYPFQIPPYPNEAVRWEAEKLQQVPI